MKLTSCLRKQPWISRGADLPPPLLLCRGPSCSVKVAGDGPCSTRLSLAACPFLPLGLRGSETSMR